MLLEPRKSNIYLFIFIGIVSVFFALNIKFSFDFEQFFPVGDEDLEFFRDFIKEFETDDNFLLIGIERKDGIFEQEFLQKVNDFSLKAKKLPHVTGCQSLTQLSYPLKTPFALTTIPAIHIDQPEKYASDKKKILNDERLLYNLVAPDGNSLVILLKTINSIQLDDAKVLMESLDELIQEYSFEDYHYLGRANFQNEFVAMQKRELLVSALVSGLLVFLIMMFIFRKPLGIAIALVSIGLGMIIFLGVLSLLGRELNMMAALYPVLMVIVGTSDVIHIMSKYLDELDKGIDKRTAIETTIKEIGLATFLTSVTTAIGFASLLSSKVQPIKDFGMNAALGVIIAFITVLFFTTALLYLFEKDQLVKAREGSPFWKTLMEKFYYFSRDNPKLITVGFIGVMILSFIGISKVTTNYRIESNMPIGAKITEDFQFFEKEYAGFRPLEVAVFAQGDYNADDYKVVKSVDQLEKHLSEYEAIKSIQSITMIYKSISQMNHGNKHSYYQFPETEKLFKKYKKTASRIPDLSGNILISKDKKKARIACRVLDMGADSIRVMGDKIDTWIAANIDPNVVQFKRTGTGLILDKNAEYIRANLLQGLGVAILIVSLLMGLLFRNVKMVIISLVPNIVPLILAAAMLGYYGVELEAGISIVFAVVFGIAVDDTIHFLSKFKLMRDKGKSIEESILITFQETGKAICLTSIILFFGFLVMLFSVHPPSVTIGLLISLTLASALFSDLLLIPLLIRWLMK